MVRMHVLMSALFLMSLAAGCAGSSSQEPGAVGEEDERETATAPDGSASGTTDATGEAGGPGEAVAQEAARPAPTRIATAPPSAEAGQPDDRPQKVDPSTQPRGAADPRIPAFGEDTPAEAREAMAAYGAMMERLHAGDVEGALQHFMPLESEELADQLEQQVRLFAARVRLGDSTHEPVEGRVLGDWAMIVVRKQFLSASGEKQLEVVEEFLYRLDDEWRIVLEPMRDDPGIQPLVNDDALSLWNWFWDNRIKIRDLYR